MPLPFFYHADITSADHLILGEETSRHMVQVLRMKPQEQILLTDGLGNLLTATIASAHKTQCTVQVQQRQQLTPKPRQTSLAVALLKNANRFEWLIEKATEMGVSEIIPLRTHRTEKHHFRHDRMQQIVVSAMLQSRQTWLPKLHQPTEIKEVIANADNAHRLIAHCMDKDKMAITDYRHSESVQILIGPEGDFTEEEINVALQAGYLPVTLGNTRLRTETAAIAATACLCI